MLERLKQLEEQVRRLINDFRRPPRVKGSSTISVTDDGNGGVNLNAIITASGAPATADYLVKTANADLSAERVVTDTTTISVDWATAGQAKFNVVTGSIGPTQLEATSVVAGSYTNTNLTVDADGRITAASNGSGGSGITRGQALALPFTTY